MTTLTRTIKAQSPSGPIEIKIERTLSVQDKTSYSDGWSVNLGRELVDLTMITVKVNGKEFARDFSKPTELTAATRRFYSKAPAAAVAVIGNNFYLSQPRYEEIKAAIAEMEAKLTTAEVVEQKAIEAERRRIGDENMARIEAEAAKRGPGWCDKCGSYCYGDCSSH
jgi:hypothetical protein